MSLLRNELSATYEAAIQNTTELPIGICGGCGEIASTPEGQICESCDTWLYSEDEYE